MPADRRAFLRGVTPLALLGWGRPRRGWPGVGGLVGLDSGRNGDWRSQFPALEQRVNGHALAYLDSAATTLRPRAVIEAVAAFARRENANPGRTLHTLARRADGAYEDARTTVAGFLNARDVQEVIFTRGTTEAINLVAQSWGRANLRAGDEVVLSIAEHASSMLPWQVAARHAGARVRYLDVDDRGHLRLDELDQLLTPRTKVLVLAHVSNVLGVINPVREMCARAREAGVTTVVDGAQAVPHFAVDVQDLGADFYAFSGHKMMGPMGIGVLWGRRELLESMPPWQYGSNMAHDANADGFDLSPGALKFGAGTPNVSGAVGLAAAIRFIGEVGLDAMWMHEQGLTRVALDRLGALRSVRILGSVSPEDRISVFSFVLDGVPVPEVVSRLDAIGVGIRGGDLAAFQLLQRLGVTRAARASFYLYSSEGEVDRLAKGLERLAP